MDCPDNAFEKMYRDYYVKVFKFIYSLSTDWQQSEDITQEAFVRSYQKIDLLRDKSRAAAWISKIAYNLFLDIKRKRMSMLAEKQLVTEKLAVAEIGFTLELERKEMSRCVQGKLLLIPENHRAPLILDIQGHRNREIADILGCSLENAKIRLHRGRKKMKEILGSDCSFYYDERNVLC